MVTGIPAWRLCSSSQFWHFWCWIIGSENQIIFVWITLCGVTVASIIFNFHLTSPRLACPSLLSNNSGTQVTVKMWWGQQRDYSYSTFLNVGAGRKNLFSIWYPQLRNLDTEVYLLKDLVSIPLLHQPEHHMHRKWLLDWVYHSCSC